MNYNKIGGIQREIGKTDAKSFKKHKQTNNKNRSKE